MAFRRRWGFVLLMVLAFPGAGRGAEASRRVGIGAGSNFYGHVVTATFEQRLTPRFFGGIGFAWGGLRFHFPPGANFFGYRNMTPNDVQAFLEANFDLDLYLGARLIRGRKWVPLPEVALGWSWYDISYENVVRVPGTTGGDFRGVQELKHPALFTRLGLLEYRPSPGGFFAQVGVQARTAFLRAPLVLTTYDDLGEPYVIWAGNPEGGRLVIPLPDLYLRAGYSF